MTSILYDRVLSPFYDALAAKCPPWIHPNAITLLGGLSCATSLAAMAAERHAAAAALFTIYHALDNLDGMVARRTGKTSSLGHVLDHAIDGTVGVVASCCSISSAIFGAPHALRFTLCCGMATLLICHAAELVSGTPTLGSRYFGADELFLLNSFALTFKAVTSHPLLSLGDVTSVQATGLVLIVLLALTTVRDWRCLFGLALFGALCAWGPSPAPVVAYAITFPALLAFNSQRHHRPKPSS